MLDRKFRNNRLKLVFKETNCLLKRIFDEETMEDEYDEDISVDSKQDSSEDDCDGRSNKGMNESYDECGNEGSDETESDHGRLDTSDHNKELQRLDLEREKAIKAIMDYYNSIYFKELTIEERLNEDKEADVPSRNDFESLIGFLKMVNEQEFIEGCKDLVKEHFEKLIKWFYSDYMKCKERPMPVVIFETKVSLLDLYLTVKGLGGPTFVATRNKWSCVSKAIGFPVEYAYELKECYATHLSLLEAYYEVAKYYSSSDVVSEADVCMDTKGIGASVLPKEETILGCVGTDAEMKLDKAKEGVEDDPMEEEGSSNKNDDAAEFVIVDK